QDAIACCEVQPEEAAALRRCFAGDRRIGVHQRDGYAAVGALLPPRHGGRRIGRGLVLVDPPYEAQRGEFDPVLAALREGLARWPQGMFMLWYPVKQRAALGPFLRRAAQLPAKSVLLAELMVRAEESVLRMNGSGVLVCNPPWRLDATLEALRPAPPAALAPGRGARRVQWLRAEPCRPGGHALTPPPGHGKIRAFARWERRCRRSRACPDPIDSREVPRPAVAPQRPAPRLVARSRQPQRPGLARGARGAGPRRATAAGRARYPCRAPARSRPAHPARPRRGPAGGAVPRLGNPALGPLQPAS